MNFIHSKGEPFRTFFYTLKNFGKQKKAKKVFYKINSHSHFFEVLIFGKKYPKNEKGDPCDQIHDLFRKYNTMLIYHILTIFKTADGRKL